MINNNIAGQMVTLAYGEFVDIVSHHTEAPEPIREKTLESVRNIITSQILDHGLAWRPSNNMIYGFTKCDLINLDFNYDSPMEFMDFVTGTADVLESIFDKRTLINAIMQIKHPDIKVRYFGAETLYKGYFGYSLFTMMVDIYYSIQWLPDKRSDAVTQMMESFMFNTWWNDVVNHVPFIVYSRDEETGEEKQKFLYVKPAIAVTRQRQVIVSQCQLIDYGVYLDDEDNEEEI